MKREPDIETAAFNIDSMIEDLLEQFDDMVVDREVDMPEVDKLTAAYYWTRTWGPPQH